MPRRRKSFVTYPPAVRITINFPLIRLPTDAPRDHRRVGALILCWRVRQRGGSWRYIGRRAMRLCPSQPHHDQPLFTWKGQRSSMDLQLPLSFRLGLYFIFYLSPILLQSFHFYTATSSSYLSLVRGVACRFLLTAGRQLLFLSGSVGKKGPNKDI